MTMAPEERHLFHFRVTADRHCFRVTMTYVGITHRASYSRHVFDGANTQDKQTILRAWRLDIHCWCERMRSGAYGLRELLFQNPRKRDQFGLAEWR